MKAKKGLLRLQCAEYLVALCW